MKSSLALPSIQNLEKAGEIFNSNGLILWGGYSYQLNFSYINFQEKTNHLPDNPILLKVSNTIV